jgi:phytanoyl-CoA hydroxylase
VFHHCLSWHSSPPNVSDAWRRAYIVIYMDAKCTFAPERAPWHPMRRRVTVQRGEPFNDDVFPILGQGVAP